MSHWIVVEGLDGAGKSTQVNYIEQYFNTQKIPVLKRFAPTDDIPSGKKARKAIIDGKIPPKELLDLFIKDHTEHYNTIIAPALKAGTSIILDRYYWSTFAYQAAQGIEKTSILEKIKSLPKPDLTLYLDTRDININLERIDNRGGKKDMFETKTFLDCCFFFYT